MEILQTFESTIISREHTHLAFISIFVPADVSDRSEFSDERALAAALGSETWSVARPDQVPTFMALGLEREAFVAVGGPGGEQPFQEPKEQNVYDKRSLEFAQEVFDQQLIPLTQSPLAPDSLANLVKGAGVGAVVGYIAVAGNPMVLIVVPAGIILCGAAAGIAKALDEGLRERLLNLLRKHPRRSAKKRKA